MQNVKTVNNVDTAHKIAHPPFHMKIISCWRGVKNISLHGKAQDGTSAEFMRI